MKVILLVSIFLLFCTSHRLAINPDPPNLIKGFNQTPSRKTSITFIGTVKSIEQLGQRALRVIPVDFDSRFAITIYIESITHAEAPLENGTDQVFAVHSPSILFRSIEGDVIGKKYRFEVTLNKAGDDKTRFSNLTVRPIANEELTPGVASTSSARVQASDVSHLIPEQISYATMFVQRLSDAGLSVEKVALSKYNGGFFGPTKAAWIQTDKGKLEVVFFDKPDDLGAIQLHEEGSGNPGYHRYTISLANKMQKMEGRLPVYFTKYQLMLIITHDAEFNKTLNRILTQ